MKRIPIIAALALALSLAGCAGTSSGTSATSPEPAAAGGAGSTPSDASDSDPGSHSASDSGAAAQELQLGQPFEVKQSQGTVQMTVFSATYGPTMPGGDLIPAEKGGFLVLDVEFLATEGVGDANPFYLAVKSADGQDGEAGLGAPDALSAGPLQTGESSRGNVAFDVGAGPFTLIVTDDMSANPVAYSLTASPR
ncbi:hypothetical protein [Naasia aerilata]|uniref:hypothetical protein n=1 Tax=Naasia aerilata TaxID=1162966 RepID=UPI002572AB51|nr:hypothetical protein [Naasia aerilata]